MNKNNNTPIENKASDSSEVWEERRIEQLGFLNNLLIGLATGLLAFETQLTFNDKVALSCVDNILIPLSVLILTASVVTGIVLARNRLDDFRKKAQKEKTIELGKRTWKLLNWQICMFAFGGLLLVITTLIKYLVD